ncbi:hypothetical protein HPP92_010582 [Vanilla planifolia]|uniref:Uncharacterized protein n=1 Tax=Vanilla planifolia TaxID=51239 RepID=A0A835V2M6_VANPL|nr:hypothetical protein HPP92_010582 [Vanilla planifolia]
MVRPAEKQREELSPVLGLIMAGEDRGNEEMSEKRNVARWVIQPSMMHSRPAGNGSQETTAHHLDYIN